MPLLRSFPARVVVVALCAALSACGDGGGPPVEPNPTPTLPAGVYELSGIAETLPHTELEPFSRIVGGARFVALGESTHASAGFYQAKARLVRYMVETMGFRVLAWESSWMEALPAARYVATCAGSPTEALRGLFRVWRDAHVRDLLQWMCEWNRSHPTDPVTFFGFDIQEPWKSAPALHQFVQAAAPAEAARTARLDRCLGATHGSDQFYLSQEYRDHVAGNRNAPAHQDCLGGITDVEAWIAANAGALQGATSAAAVEEARLALVALRAYEEQLWVPDPGGYQARDYGMSQLLLRLHALHTPGKKTIVWAWNWHIARRYQEVRGWNDDPNGVVARQGARAMGSFLHDALGADYLPIGLIGYRVYQTLPNGPPVAASPLAVELRLHELRRNYLLVDLRQPIPGTLLPPGTTYQVSQEWGDPYRQFGALLFLEQSPASSLIQ